MEKEKTIEIDVGIKTPDQQGIKIQQDEFVSREFMKYYRLLQHVTIAPTHTPKNFFEQIVFLDNGTTYELYIYINGVWKKTTLV